MNIKKNLPPQDFRAISPESDIPSSCRASSNENEHRNGNGLLLFNELIRHPRSIGTVCPSSRYLAGRMAASINLNEPGFIVELGGGTGKITASLLRCGVSPDKLIVIEKSLRMAQYLKLRFPRVRVLHGDAIAIPVFLQHARSVSAVISGLPLRSLPRNTVTQIASGWARTLTINGRVVQFTYSPFRSSAWLQAGLKRTSSETVWANFPPARVEIFNSISTGTSSSGKT